MSYCLSDSADGCDGWAVLKTHNDEIVSCHKTKKEAIIALTKLHFDNEYIKRQYDSISEEVVEEVQKIVDEIRERLLNDGEL